MKMKIVISALTIIILMIGVPTVYAHRLTDTEQEVGIKIKVLLSAMKRTK